MFQEKEVGSATQEELNSVTFKLPVLMPPSSKCGLPNGDDSLYEEREVAMEFKAANTVESLPDISAVGKQRVIKAVTFECDQHREVDNEESVLRLPDIKQSFGFTSWEEKRVGEDCLKNENFSQDDCVSVDRGFPQVAKKDEFQREKRHVHCSQKLSRSKFSYFPRFPSPKPLSKQEKLKQEIEERTAKKHVDVIHPGSLRSKEEYSQIFLSLKNVERKFEKKHKLACRASFDSPFFLD